MDDMQQKNHIYAAIDLKSFYASVECVERGLDPMYTNLVVADTSRTEKTICLAVSPSLKSYGIPGRPRLFEVIQRLREVNAKRLRQAPGQKFTGASRDKAVLERSPDLAVGYIAAVPRMAFYMKYSTRIRDIYLRYVAPEDMHVYSIDEVFIDISAYLKTYGLAPRQLVAKIMQEVYDETGITATCGIGTNLYLCKVAMDIVAKHMPADKNGVRIAELDEMSYRKMLWSHRPLTDFWRVGKGYAKKLEENGIYTMGDVARCSLGKGNEFYNEELLYRLFGVNAELLIDHAWGWEPCTIADIKAYRPENNSISSGQVLQCPYDYNKARLIVCEMTDVLVLELVDKRLVTDQIVLTIGYDRENLKDPDILRSYRGEIVTDRYGRKIPKHAHGTMNLDRRTSSTKRITDAVMELYERITDKTLLIRKITIAACRVTGEQTAQEKDCYEQMELFTDYEARKKEQQEEKSILERERKMQEAVIGIKKKYGKNAVIRGLNLEEGATGMKRNNQIGGHKA